MREVEDQIKRLLSINGKKTVREFHWELGRIMWDYVGMARNEQGLQKAISDIQALREEFWKNVKVVGEANDYNKRPRVRRPGRRLPRARRTDGHGRAGPGRVVRRPLPGGVPDARRRSAAPGRRLFCHVSVWEYKGEIKDSVRHKEPLVFEYAKPSQRSYK